MGSKQVVRVAGVEYEPQTLNMITEPAALDYAFDMIREYAIARFPYVLKDNGGLDFKPASPTEKRKIGLFNSIFEHLRAILAADLNNVIDFGVMDALLEGLRTSPDDFDKLYQAAVKTNPQLKTMADQEKDAAAATGGAKGADPLAA